jgi:hypothetical protein
VRHATLGFTQDVAEPHRLVERRSGAGGERFAVPADFGRKFPEFLLGSDHCLILVVLRPS